MPLVWGSSLVCISWEQMPILKSLEALKQHQEISNRFLRKKDGSDSTHTDRIGHKETSNILKQKTGINQIRFVDGDLR